MSKDNSEFGRILSALRAYHGLSLREVAKYTDLSHAAIRNVENGADPRLSTVMTLSRVYGVDVFSEDIRNQFAELGSKANFTEPEQAGAA